jgi:hypothetical protein
MTTEQADYLKKAGKDRKIGTITISVRVNPIHLAAMMKHYSQDYRAPDIKASTLLSTLLDIDFHRMKEKCPLEEIPSIEQAMSFLSKHGIAVKGKGRLAVLTEASLGFLDTPEAEKPVLTEAKSAFVEEAIKNIERRT